MMGDLYKIVVIVFVGMLGFLWVFSQYKVAEKNGMSKQDLEFKIEKIGYLKTNNGLLIELFEISRKNYICIIPVQTRASSGASLRVIQDLSLAPTLECLNR